ncbi:MAG: hypothetical protein ACP5NZ_04915 [Nanobdellota archaeon]
MKKQKLSGLVMFIIGFIILLVNAAGYIFNLNIKSPSLTVIGLVFVVIGMRIVKNGNK